MPFNPTLGNKKHTLPVAVDFSKPTSRNPFLQHLYDDLDSQKRQISKINAGLFINVTDYGAKGDGTSDDTNAINSAITAAAAGKIIYFPAGTYLVSDELTITSDYLSFLGDLGATLLRGGDDAIMRISGDRCNIENLRFDGNKDTEAVVNAALIIDGSYNYCNRLEVFDSTDHGINLDGQLTTCAFNSVMNCYIHDNDGVGIGQNTVTDSYIAFNDIFNNELEGISIDVTAFRHQVIGNKIRANCQSASGVAGIALDNGSNAIIQGNTISDTQNSKPGLRTQDNTGNTRNSTITGNTFINNTGWGIHLFNGSGGDADFNIVLGNIFQGNTSGALLIDANIDKTIVVANMFNGQTYTNNGTATTAGNNVA